MDWGLCNRWIALLAMISAGSVLASAQAFDLHGKSVNPLSKDSGQVVVLVFLRRDCPISGRYAPVIQQVSSGHSSTTKFFLVYVDKDETTQGIRRSIEEYGYHLPALRDPNHDLVKMAHVQVTPEVAVFDRERRLVYAGRIDDRYIDLGRARPAPTTHELEDAIRAALAGVSVSHKEVRGIGCYISDVQ